MSESTILIELKVRSIHTGEQFVPALCERRSDSDRVQCLYGNEVEGIFRIIIELRDHDKSFEVTHHGLPYPIERFQGRMARIAALRGVQPDAIPLARRLLPSLVVPPAVRSETAPVAQNTPVRPNPTPGDVSIAPTIVGTVAAELGLTPSEVRRRLRTAGLSAPYTDIELIRRTLRET